MIRRLAWGAGGVTLLLLAAFASMVRIVPARPPAPVATPTQAAAPQAMVLTSLEGPGVLIVPVLGVERTGLHDTWGESRASGAREHHAIDILAPRGTPVLAAADGVVEKLFDSIPGGHTVYVRVPGGATVHYYAHLDSYAAGLHEGQAVRQGQPIGTVGTTGNASPDAPHLHFEVKAMQPGERWWQGVNVNPYPLLAPEGTDG